MIASHLVLAVSSFGVFAAADPITADLLVINAKVWTGNPAKPQNEALAVCGNRIAAVGTNKELAATRGPRTRVIDARGRCVLPAFNDAHVHFARGGASLTSVQLRTAQSETEFQQRLTAYAHQVPAGQWITGGNWDHENWPGARLPARQLIDQAAGDHPVLLNRLDGHMSLANSAALRLAHISRDTKDVPGGIIVRDAHGEPTGILKDAAQGLVQRVIPQPSERELEENILAAARYALSQGVTSVQDMSASPPVLSAYQRLVRRRVLMVRVSGHQPLPSWGRLATVGIQAHLGSEYLHIGGLKGFADGSLGSTTALLFEPYLDAPHTFGIPSDELSDPDRMWRNIEGADRAGLQIAIHAIGDRANNTILNLYERLIREHGQADRRLRIEHAQHLISSDIPRFAALHVIASMQPYHCIDDGRWAEHRIGPERAKTTYAFRSLIDSGATLAFGSDWPVAPLEPIRGIYAAVTRRTLDGKHPDGWIPNQKITVAEAVRAYTAGSAFASFDEGIKGSIEVGKLADLVILSRDIFAIDPEQINNVQVDITVFDGKVVYTRQ